MNKLVFMSVPVVSMMPKKEKQININMECSNDWCWTYMWELKKMTDVDILVFEVKQETVHR